ncbi:MAG: glutamine-hydrolyzing GMP synthase [Candidatus Goldbacteria bacterium]|nr:glutamine-hydrolyzing GMP synthase [Candidatus Goldiibacteriota bacterium]
MGNMIIILDFGSQVTQLIARRIRELNIYSEIYPFNYPVSEIKKLEPKGIILSGSPASVYDKNPPLCSKEIFNLGIPILGICYGMQIIAKYFGGKVEGAHKHSIHREYGFAELIIKDKTSLLKGLKEKEIVWMSHGDKLAKLPKGFKILGVTEKSPYAVIENRNRKIFAVQFHPEVVHTRKGKKILSNFAVNICKCQRNWTPESYISKTISDIRQQTQGERVLCAVSGGVDSTVTAILIHKAIGDKLVPVFVNNGLLRLNEEKRVLSMFKKLNIKINYINAEKGFLKRLKGVTDPERKRKIIGNYFIEVFENFANKKGKFNYLAQGTLYPDLIESVSVKGPSATIKSHHNVGGLPEKMKLKLIEPLKYLFKDEVRIIGKKLGLPDEVIKRQPFPGPGLAVRILGEITKERLNILKKADNIIVDEIKKAGLYHKIWQTFGVLLPVKTVGVMGDKRTYENVIALRAVHSNDGMTAEWVRLPYDLLNRIASRVINEVKYINRVVYDISNKPPATIEWE